MKNLIVSKRLLIAALAVAGGKYAAGELALKLDTLK
jgi:hypothetical protein